MSHDHERRVALAAVTKAAHLCGAVRGERVVQRLEKGDRSPVTVADFGSQALVCRELRASFPRDPIVAEEDAAELRRSDRALEEVAAYVGRFHPGVTAAEVCAWIDEGGGRVAARYWTLDPIDGTKGFLRNDQYAVALALVEEGEVVVAALACPALPLRVGDPTAGVGTVFLAVRGGGATMVPLDGGEPARVSVAAGAPDRMRFVESVEPDHGNHALQAAVAGAVGITADSLRMDSQAKYGALARGDAVLYLRLPSPGSPDYREKVWDHAAGALIVEEAGGRVTDMRGRPLDFASGVAMRDNRGVVASNGRVHGAALAAIAARDA